MQVSVEGGPKAEIQELKIVDGTMTFGEMADGLVIKAGSSADLFPKQSHRIALLGLKSPYTAGELVKGTLVFKKQGKVDVQFEVMDGNMTGMKMN